ncbi:MAG TPA: FHA domain-containing protein [Rhodothermales bacterium]|nr:FHA domain-containing protein [Rhodothermales bacterium]
MSSRRRLALRVRAEHEGALVTEGVFTEAFVVGRSEEAGLRIDAALISREHAEVSYEDGRWWVRDLGSTNGTFAEGERVDEVAVEGPTVVEFGRGGPRLLLEEVDAPASVPTVADGSLTQVIDHYFAHAEAGGGERTMLIRDAYRRVHRSHRRRIGVVLVALLVVAVAAIGIVTWQQTRVTRLEGTAQNLFLQLRSQDLQIAQLRQALPVLSDSEFTAVLDEIERRRAASAAASDARSTPGTTGPTGTTGTPGTTGRTGTTSPGAGGLPRGRRIDPARLASLIADAETRRAQIETQYDAFVEDLGVYRRASPEEQEIFRVARIFNESDIAVPEGFVREVLQNIEWWRSHGLAGSVARANQNGYTPIIVSTMRRYGLPPEFFYLALVESHFDEPNAVGPATRWGIAKGLWQFIPSTGLDYGLQPGPLADQRVYDPLDDRFVFAKATDAAAQYLLKLYTDISQASGLLAMASYNWGEGRVLPRLRSLPAQAPAEATPLELAEAQLSEIPQDPQQRSYWRFLNAYGNQMPQETRNYVLRIFSAAVIGRNPRLFGFNFDNPLAPYMQGAPTPP